MKIFLTSLFAFLSMSLSAEAGPVFFAALSSGAGFGAAFAATTVGGFLTSSIIGRLLLSVAFSALQAAMVKKPQPPGIVTETTLTGSTQPLSFMIGLYATGGSLSGPPRAHGKEDKTPNAYRQYIVTLGAVPGMQLSRLMINGEYVTLGAVPHADYGLPIQGRFDGYAWVKYYDGTQTAADPMLLAKYGSDPDRPWTADMVGTGLCYAILTFRFSQTIWTSGEPSWRFELAGIPLYDPRKDTTVGGSGAHRWANRATWEPSNNPLVQGYNILRGITLPGLAVWGGGFPSEDLPLSSWFAAMNVCDQMVARPDAATEARFRTGYEIRVSDEPAAILEELFKASATLIAEVGGLWKPRTGGPGLPVWFMTDEDIIITSPQELDPFPGSDQRFNGATATCPDPAMVWESQPVPDYTNPAWEAEDGGKRRLANLPLAACPYPLQAQRVIAAYAKDDRRFRRHNHTLPPDAAVLEPLDTIGWTSARNGYVTKHFEIGDMRDEPISILQNVALREVNPADYVDAPGYGQIAPVIATTRPMVPAQLLAGFNALPGTTLDATGNPRRPHIHLIWDGAEQDGVGGIEWEIRLSLTETHVSRGSTSDVMAGELRVFDGVLPNVSYQARGRQIATWPVGWTDWKSVTTSDVRIGLVDMTVSVQGQLADHDALRAQHDALVAGFSGTLDAAFDTVEAVAQEALLARRRGWCADPTFTGWTSGNLTATNWADRSGTSLYATEAGGAYGGGLSINVPTGTGAVEVLASSAAGLVGADATADYVVAEIEATVTAADLTVARFGVEWSNDGTTWTRGTLGAVAQSMGRFADIGLTVKAGTRQVVKTLWKRPAGVSGHIRYRLTPKTSAVTTATQMAIGYADVRAATQADIDAGAVFTVATATPGQTTTAVGAGAAIAALNSGVTARLGANEAAIATTNTTVATNSSAIAATQTTLSATSRDAAAALNRAGTLEGEPTLESASLSTSWGTSASFTPASVFGSDSNGAFFAPAMNSGNAVIIRPIAPLATGKVYRVTARVLATLAGNVRIAGGLVPVGGAAVSAVLQTPITALVAGQLTTVSWVIGQTATGQVNAAVGTAAQWGGAGLAGVRWGVQVSSTTAGGVLQVYDILVEDFTASNALSVQTNASIATLNATNTTQDTATALLRQTVSASVARGGGTLMQRSEFSTAQTGSPSTIQPLAANATYGPRTSEVTSTDPNSKGLDVVAAAYVPLYTIAAYAIDPSRKYRIRVRVRRDAYVSGNANFYYGYVGLTDAFAAVGSNTGHRFIGGAITVAMLPVGAWTEYLSPIITGTSADGSSSVFASGITRIRLTAALNHNSSTAGNITRISVLELIDVTDGERIGVAEASISSISLANTSRDASIASLSTNLTATTSTANDALATANAASSAVTVQATAMSSLQGGIGQYVIGASSAAAGASIELTAKSLADGTAAASQIVLKSDKFRFEGDLAEFLGTVQIHGSLLVDGSVSTVYHFHKTSTTHITGWDEAGANSISNTVNIIIAPRRGEIHFPDNPCLIEISAVFWLAAADEVQIFLRRFDGTNWHRVGWTRALNLPAGHSYPCIRWFDIISYGHVSGLEDGLYQFLVYKKTPYLDVQVSQVAATMQQVNK